MRHKTLVRNSPSALLTLGIFTILFSKINWPEIFAIFGNLNIPYALMAIMISLFSSAVIGVDRFRFTLKAFGHQISFKEAFFIKMGSQPLNVLPSGKWNLLLQIIYLKHQRDFPFLSGIHMVVLLLFLNFISWILLIIPSVLYFVLIKKIECSVWFEYTVSFLAIIGILCILLSAILKSESFQKIFLSKINRLNSRWKERIYALFEIYRMITYQKLFLLLLYSMVFQYSALLVYHLLVNSLGLQIPFSSIILFTPIIILLTGIPLTFAGLGVRESLVLFFFSSYGPHEAILSLGVLFSLSEYILPPLLGLVFTKSFIARLLFGYPEKMGEIPNISE